MFKSKAILMSLGQDPKVVEHATEFLYLTAPSVFLDMIANVYSQWLSQFKLQHVPTLTSVCSFLVFVPLVYLLAVQWQMEIRGLAYGYVFFHAINSFLLTVYAHCFLP